MLLGAQNGVTYILAEGKHTETVKGRRMEMRGFIKEMSLVVLTYPPAPPEEPYIALVVR